MFALFINIFIFFDEGILSIYISVYMKIAFIAIINGHFSLYVELAVDEADFLVFISSSTNKTSNLQQFINDSRGEIKEV